jgi:predicted transposase YbfD/YdcC
VTKIKSGKTTVETVYGITSHTSASAGAADLLAYVRGHWSIENPLHWRRDVTFGEDKSALRIAHAPHNMAAFRNLAIGLLGQTARAMGGMVDFPTIMRALSFDYRRVFALLAL